MIKTIGKDISKSLVDIEEIIWDFEYDNPTQQFKYTKEGFRGAIKILMSNLLDKMWDYQKKNKVPQKEREKQAHESGQAIRALIKKYTGIDSHDFYKKKK
jgi:hypothetical protein